MWDIDRVARELTCRATARRAAGRITTEWPELDLARAYTAQDRLVELRVQERAETVVGVKLGLTSEAKQRRMGISAPLTAWVTNGMRLAPGEPLEVASLIHPRVEPEIVFEMAEDLAGPGVTRESAMRAVASVRAGLEVIDSRFVDFSFALPDVVADNASAAAYVVGDMVVGPEALDLAAEPCTLTVDGESVAKATGADVQGHPGEALALAANALGERGHRIKKGSLVLTGGLTDAVFLTPGATVTATFGHLGSVSLSGT
ncbi:2-keto-4-pentenoate hydratase [Streptomyces jeddahensis]|uniref:2-hydroxyhexa-2,4-dienoate hydratase n=1 Tax=Streptomyces jeddahensis TaxID=1716141 RepID=A0A177HSG6_9ACTN|nr:fumarylacetoacetate hydrolase family protein [Streptomyces jeddahensis]OAH13951.1 2-hydroxyhexa-2,4-dienoate hydratase [Streptomyces jeddahensis]